MTQQASGFTILSNTVDLGGAAVSAFGTLETAELTPLIQLDFIYGINPQMGASTVSGAGATVDVNAARLRIQSGTGSAGSAVYQSRKTIRYRPGQGCVARWTTAFGTAYASNTQITGAGTSQDGYFFGYNGTAFGLSIRARGSDTWVAQTAWNGDKCDGSGPSVFTINPQFGNVYQVKYPFLGYGTIRYYIQNPVTGAWILVHTIAYPNTTTATQLGNPALNFYAQQLNSGNTTNSTLYVGSVGMFLSGERVFVGSPKWATDADKGSITTEAALLNLKNCTSYNGVANKGLLRLNAVMFASTAAHVAFFRFKLGATIGGSPSYTPVNGSTSDGGATLTSANSMASVDTAGTYTSGGLYLFGISALGNNSLLDLTNYDIFVAPGEILTITGACSNSTEIGCALDWSEDS